MRAIQIQRYGGPEVLLVAELPDPKPGPGEVLVQVAAAGVNFVDVYNRTGHYPQQPPFVPGVEAAGEVVAVGEGVTAHAPGDRVVSAQAPGAYAELVALPAERAIALPEAVTDETGAAVMLQGLTAHYLVLDSFRVHPGDPILVHAAAGGMGLLLTHLVTFLGGRVLATASTPEKRELALAAGAERAVDYSDLPAAAREFTHGEGVAAVYDGVGRDTFDASVASLRPRGTMVSYGSASGPVPSVALPVLTEAGSVMLTRPSLRHFIADPAELRQRARDVLRWAGDGTLPVRIGGRYPLAEASRAHDDLESRRTTGKLLIIP